MNRALPALGNGMRTAFLRSCAFCTAFFSAVSFRFCTAFFLCCPLLVRVESTLAVVESCCRIVCVPISRYTATLVKHTGKSGINVNSQPARCHVRGCYHAVKPRESDKKKKATG